MKRSSVESWLDGPGDLATREVEDVPVKGQSVLVRGLPASYSAEVQSQMKLVQDGNEQIAKIDVAEMEVLQFQHGVIEPQFSRDKAEWVAKHYGPAFRKVINVIDDLSGIDKEEIEKTTAKFPAGDESPSRPAQGNGLAGGSGRPDLPLRAGAGTEDDD